VSTHAELVLESTLRPALRAPFGSTSGAVGPTADPAEPWPDPAEAYQVLWHAEADDVAASLPGLWALPRVAAGNTGGCVDLVVDVDVLGRIVSVDLEAVPLSEVLLALGDPDGAMAAEQAVGQQAEVAGPAVADLLERLWVLAAG